MYASVNASRRSIDYGALLRASHTPAAAGSGGRGSTALPLPPPPPCISEMRQVTELLLLADDDAVDSNNHLSWLLSASPLAAGLSGEADEDDDDGGEMITDDDSSTAKWRRLVRAGLPPSTPVCSIHCTDPLLILRTLAHWCVPWRATPAPFLDLLFIVRAQNVSAPLSSALCGGELTDLCVRDAAERVVHARANWNATTAATARTDRFLRFSQDIDPIDINRPSGHFKYELFCPTARILRAAALHRLYAALVVAADDARHAHGLLAQDSIDLLEYLLVQHSAPRPVRVDPPPAYLTRRAGLNYASKVEDDDREAEECGWFQPGGLRSARLLAWLLCASTVSETHKFGDARPFGLLDGSGAPPEIVQWCSDLLVPRFRAMHEDAPKDEKHWILEVARMRCARSVLVRAALNIGAADLALSCAAAGGCGGRVPRTSTVRLPVYERIMWNWRDQTVEPCRIALPRELMMSGWDFFVRGASAEHFGEKLLYRLLRSAVKHPAQQPTWFMRAILLYPATLELLLLLLLRPPTTQSSSNHHQIWAIEEDLDGSLSLPRDADQDAEMAKRVAARVLQSFVDAPAECARGQVLVLLRVWLAAARGQQFPEAFWLTTVSAVLGAMRSAEDMEVIHALAAVASATGTVAAFRAAAVVSGGNNADRDAALAGVLVWPAAGTDEVVELADARWWTDAPWRINTYLQYVQRARRLGCPWGPEAGWYASDEATRMQQLEELNAWIVSEQRAANAIFSTFPDSGK